MGTDIHGKFQKHNERTSDWEEVDTEFQFDRHYQLFVVLADVRNGYGFAGTPSGDQVQPIASPRGLPKDLEPFVDMDSFEFGDHSYSWLTADEMLEWYANAPVVTHCGVLSREAFWQWDKVSPPDAYSLGVSGPGVVVVDRDDVRDDWTHVRCEWKMPLAEELAYFFDEVARLQKEHGQVRFVFGFDS